jgi:hypothetical protein
MSSPRASSDLASIERTAPSSIESGLRLPGKRSYHSAKPVVVGSLPHQDHRNGHPWSVWADDGVSMLKSKDPRAVDVKNLSAVRRSCFRVQELSNRKYCPQFVPSICVQRGPIDWGLQQLEWLGASDAEERVRGVDAPLA